MTSRPARLPAFVLAGVAMAATIGTAHSAPASEAPSARGGVPSEDRNAMKRKSLVDELRRMGIKDEAVLGAIGRVPRHEFVSAGQRDQAYGNHPLPIAEGQTISQPYVVAFMTEAAKLTRTSNVLEIGTGSGYQAAVLADLLGLGPGGGDAPKGRLASIEIIPSLAESAKKTLGSLGYAADLRLGDGHGGWPEKAPFDAILVTAAPGEVPAPLKEQLAVGGRLVIPVGEENQQLTIVTRTEKGYREETVLPVRFVPMTR